jgi:hypothetical protein
VWPLKRKCCCGDLGPCGRVRYFRCSELYGADPDDRISSELTVYPWHAILTATHTGDYESVLTSQNQTDRRGHEITTPIVYEQEQAVVLFARTVTFDGGGNRIGEGAWGPTSAEVLARYAWADQVPSKTVVLSGTVAQPFDFAYSILSDSRVSAGVIRDYLRVDEDPTLGFENDIPATLQNYPAYVAHFPHPSMYLDPAMTGVGGALTLEDVQINNRGRAGSMGPYPPLPGSIDTEPSCGLIEWQSFSLDQASTLAQTATPASLAYSVTVSGEGDVSASQSWSGSKVATVATQVLESRPLTFGSFPSGTPTLAQLFANCFGS